MSAQIKTKIVSIIRSDFDQTPKNWEGDDWYDNAEEVADDIIALFSPPAPAEVDVEGLGAKLGSKAQALYQTRRANDVEGWEAASALWEAATALAKLAAERDRLEREKAAALGLVQGHAISLKVAEARASALEVERDRLRRVLEQISTLAPSGIAEARHFARAAIRKETT